jgi:hypothetical protein
MNAVEIREQVLHWMQFLPVDWDIGNNGRGVLIRMLNDAVRLGASMKESNQRRKEVLAWLFRDYLGKPMASEISSKELPIECWFALDQYAEPTPDQETGAWTPKPGFNDAMCVCWIALAQWDAAQRAMCGIEAGERV